MPIIKKLVLIALIPLTAIAFATSCSKQAGANKKGKQHSTDTTPKVGKKVTSISKADGTDSEGKNSLTVTRDGQYASINWRLDVPISKIKQINIMRSPTGLLETRKKVAELKPDATSCKDSLPDENAQSYWVQLVTTDDKIQLIGPARAAPDKAGSAHYIHPEDAYKVSITRTDEIATLKWEFPEEKYTAIQVVRNTRPVTQPFKGKSTDVLTTLEGKSQYNNPLKNANAEYWYWFRIITKSGTVIYKGPVKAEYVRSKR